MIRMTFYVVAMLLLAQHGSVMAEAALVTHGVSHHFGAISPYWAWRAGMCDSEESCARTRYQEVNPGIGARWAAVQGVAVQAGVYHNSYARTSAYAIVEVTPLRSSAGVVSVGAFAGLVTGYPYSDFAPMLAGGLVGRLRVGSVEIVLRGVPKIRSTTHGVIAVELAIPIAR